MCETSHCYSIFISESRSEPGADYFLGMYNIGLPHELAVDLRETNCAGQYHQEVKFFNSLKWRLHIGS